MINVVYTLIALSMLIMWLSMNEDDDDMDGGKNDSSVSTGGKVSSPSAFLFIIVLFKTN